MAWQKEGLTIIAFLYVAVGILNVLYVFYTMCKVRRPQDQLPLSIGAVKLRKMVLAIEVVTLVVGAVIGFSGLSILGTFAVAFVEITTELRYIRAGLRGGLGEFSTTVGGTACNWISLPFVLFFTMMETSLSSGASVGLLIGAYIAVALTILSIPCCFPNPLRTSPVPLLAVHMLGCLTVLTASTDRGDTRGFIAGVLGLCSLAGAPLASALSTSLGV